VNVHKNARLTAHSRAELVRRVLVEGQSMRAVATAFGIDAKTVGKWVKRFEAEGLAGLETDPPGPASFIGRRRSRRWSRSLRCAVSASVASRSPSRRRYRRRR
jgi:transposase-like protein